MDRLPTEILRQIIEFVPKNNRKNVAEICKKFHEIVCDFDKLDMIVRFKDKHVSDFMFNSEHKIH